MAVGLGLVWGFLVGARPGQPIHSDPYAGLLYASLVIMRLLVVSCIVQTAFLSLSLTELTQTIYAFGLRGELFLMALGALVVLPEMRLRSAQIYDATKARGLLGKHPIVGSIRTYPYVARNLFAWTLRAAQMRAELWESSGILEDTGQWQWDGIRLYSVELILLALSGMFLFLSTYLRLLI
jgi:energy-coupling factor transporter transmembrane protein EcfT